MSYPIPCAKAWNSALLNSRIESRFSPKLCVALATVQPCLIHCLMPKPGKAGFYKALFRFGNGTALSYLLPYAKARNSALPNSRIESRFSPKLCSALAPVQLCFIQFPVPKPVKACFFNFTRVNIQSRMADFQSSVPLWHRYSLVLSIALCQSL